MITVITSITGGKDYLIEEQCTDGAKFIAFVDQIQSSKTWELRKAYDRFISPRRNSRFPKIQPHQAVDTDYSLWIDGNVQLIVPAKTIIDDWLSDVDIALCKHHARDCIYDEAAICAQYKLDNPSFIIEQTKKYQREGYGTHRGMGECTVIARKHTAKVEAFNNYWWSEHCRHSVRDQISFMYAADKAGIKVKLIDQTVYKNPYFKVVDHLTPRKE